MEASHFKSKIPMQANINDVIILSISVVEEYNALPFEQFEYISKAEAPSITGKPEMNDTSIAALRESPENNPPNITDADLETPGIKEMA